METRHFKIHIQGQDLHKRKLGLTTSEIQKVLMDRFQDEYVDVIELKTLAEINGIENTLCVYCDKPLVDRPLTMTTDRHIVHSECALATLEELEKIRKR